VVRSGDLVIGTSGDRKIRMVEQQYRNEGLQGKVPEERYAYYRRCQVFRKNGVQCKAPAEKGSYICHAHAGQLATAVHRERERRAVLVEAVAEMRRRGKPECEPVDLFMDFKGIQVTLAVMAQAVIDGRIDCKTAGRMVVQLQMASKLLWMLHRKKRKTLPLINADHADLKGLPRVPEVRAVKNWAANQREETRITLMPEVQEFGIRRGWAHAPPQRARAA
jgi:hypothetical protein